MQEVPAPKTLKPVQEIEKVNTEDNKLSIVFSGKDKVTWEFQCPSKRCANKWAQKIDEAMAKSGGRQTGNFGSMMDSRTRKDNLNQIDTYLNNSPPPQNNQFNANVTGQGNNNANFSTNIEGGRLDANRSVFENRSADFIKIDESPSPQFQIHPQPISPPSFNTNVETRGEQHSGDFTINANFNNGPGAPFPRQDMMFSQANSLGSHQNTNVQQDRHYF